MGFGTTFAMLSFLMIFAGMSLFVINVQQSMSGAATAMRTQQDATLNAQRQDISITASSHADNQEREWSITYADDFAQGSFNQTETSADAVALAGANTSGTYTSNAYDTGYSSNYTTISWNGIGTLAFQIRSADTLLGLQEANFLGPDATTASSYTTPGAQINETHDNDTYIQYRVTLSGASPQVQDTAIGVIRETGHATLTIENTGSEKLNPEETDAYIDGIRITRDEANRVYELESGIDERLWNPGEELTLTVFTASPATITINNDRAQDTENI